MAELIVRGGRIVTARGVRAADVAIEQGRIVAVGRDLAVNAERTVDATGLLVFPGIIDAHTHPVYLDDLVSLPITAAYGGVTTVIHFAYAKPGEGLMDTIHRFREEGEAGSVLDFALHGGLFDPAHQSHEIPQAIEAGVTSHKMFMTYAKLGWMTDDYQLMRTMDILGAAGGMAMVHAENGLATDYLQDKTNEAGANARDVFVQTRPAILEAEALHRAIAMAQVGGCPLYIPHMTALLGVLEIARAKALGYRVYAETCPQYLTLTEQALIEQGPLVKIGPPLRSESDRTALWQALADGTIDTIASDHAAKAKTPEDDFFAAPYGSPQVETMLPLAFHGGVNGGWISLSRLAQVMCENPARIFGLFPQKGVIQPGSDADLVLFDPQRRTHITYATQHSNASYTAYEGMDILGSPVMSMQRGDILLEQGTLHASAGHGQFLPTRSGHATLAELRFSGNGDEG
ncbi:dihydropyrimidinase [Candidatus Bipolaricaulota bacterium]|nr:dihydropyrimidinase [Candidatus Bipolaricaulota bacterium]